ncbi:MAG TPA: DUF167 domain-containing protein [Candidatus Paceibacterota bacterium]|nr:DUF167 domain-containing protein [Candidatus Paceibacterota bacterium]
MYIKVRVKPNSRKEKIKKIKDNEFLLEICEPAERGLANKRVCEIIHKYFDKPTGGVRIINGHMSQVKLLRVGNN